MATSAAAQGMFDISRQTSESAVQQSSVTTPASDHRRTWLWCFLAIIAAAQFTFVRELFALYIFFAVAFVAIACVVVALFMAQRAAQLAFARVSTVRRPILGMAAVSTMAVSAPVGHEHRKAA